MDPDPRQYENIAINDNEIHDVVLSYLIHNCYNESVESFIACTGMKQPTDYLENMEKRKRIFHCALEGNALKAIELTEKLAPDILNKNKDLEFDLLSLHFVELARCKKCTEALEFAQTKLSPFGKEQKYMEKLQDFMALLAYKEPEKSPVFHLLSSEFRQQVTDSLNRAILAHLNLPSYAAMERLIQQATVVRQCLTQEPGKDGPPPFSLKDFIRS
ncbi:PREDICTED: glucose-induced degradation protein 8 homolog [Lupinus angustifolius]|uniref:glucose-induced degradation protein 8 homolog n=1 Tax=Lupinus angustifolius TaxID=3871 RepID=UPI00092E4C04|nr:PREDICTED: glucose-induced degradation protein 8 homolog [Lupinus angustifolius]XP_019414975.1 PREDICTED: glucose-induced degradation protein 8 homolog [Lupinus angustifolius]